MRPIIRHATLLTIALSLPLLLLCNGCATAPLNTPSGRPEVTIQAPVDQVKAALASQLLNHGYMIMRTEGASLVGEKSGGLALQIFAGNSSAEPKLRARFNVIDLPDSTGTRVVGSLFATHIGFAHDGEETPWHNPRTDANLQYMLDCLRAQLEHTPPPPQPEPPAISQVHSPHDR